MDVVHAGGKSDHLALINGHRQMMTGGAQEFACKTRSDRVVKDVWCDVGKDRLVAAIENSGLQRHDVVSLCPANAPAFSCERAIELQQARSGPAASSISRSSAATLRYDSRVLRRFVVT